MGDKETMAGLVLFGGQNLIENLRHIPADKLTWKPAPEANSALEIANHILQVLGGFNAELGGEKPAAAVDFESTQSALKTATQEFARLLRAATPEQMEAPFDLGGMVVPLGSFATMNVVDILHHHGQIVYLQTLLGDTEMHFDPNAFVLLP